MTPPSPSLLEKPDEQKNILKGETAIIPLDTDVNKQILFDAQLPLQCLPSNLQQGNESLSSETESVVDDEKDISINIVESIFPLMLSKIDNVTKSNEMVICFSTVSFVEKRTDETTKLLKMFITMPMSTSEGERLYRENHSSFPARPARSVHHKLRNE
ncbi:hypothetical protein C0J52_27192 [Blattella germanica]|nr:hypothetical protein C0J52_27192 [Blattella germanica]